MVYARVDLVREAIANLGINYQTDASGTRTRAELVSEAMNCLGMIQQAFASGTKTRNDLILHTLEILGILQAGQTASAEDISTIELMIDPTLADLGARAIVSVTNTASIPNVWFNAVAVLVAFAARSKYGLTGEEEAALIALAGESERRLKTITRTALVDEKLPSIMAELNARNIATVTLTAIPQAWFSSLADIVAQSVKADFTIDPALSGEIAQRAARSEIILKNLNNANVVDRNIDGILADLAARNVVHVADDSDIPQEWFMHLAAIVADRCKGKGFTLDESVMQRVGMEGQRAVMELRELTRGRPSYNTLQTNYF